MRVQFQVDFEFSNVDIRDDSWQKLIRRALATLCNAPIARIDKLRVKVVDNGVNATYRIEKNTLVLNSGGNAQSRASWKNTSGVPDTVTTVTVTLSFDTALEDSSDVGMHEEPPKRVMGKKKRGRVPPEYVEDNWHQFLDE